MRSWGSILAVLIGAVVGMGIVARAANAEGVVNGGSFVSGGIESAASLIDSLGDTQLHAPFETGVSRQASRVALRPASLGERTKAETGADLFRHSRLVLPLVMKSAVGESVDVALAASDIRSMNGPMVGLRPHPRTWGSTLDR
jgi:hypothetical protein